MVAVSSPANSTTTHEYTVVGIVEDEGEYANTDAYGFFHIYAPLDMVKNLIAKHSQTQPFYVDEAMYYPKQVASSLSNSNFLLYRRDAENPEQIQFRVEGNRMYSVEEWDINFKDVPCNAGYIIELTLDSGRNYAEFYQLLNGEYRFFTTSSARGYYTSQWNNYQNQLLTKPDYQFKLPQIIQEVYDADELDDWYKRYQEVQV